MHIFVINLPEAASRREAIERQLCQFNLTFELVPAIRGKSLTPQERQRHYDEKRCLRTFGRALGAGELGCSLSHITCYRKMIEKKISHALILEDDAWLNPNLPQILEVLETESASSQPEVILLTWASPVANPYRRLWAGYGLQPVCSAQCTHGYVLTLAAAEALLDALYPVHNVPDCWDWVLKHNVVQIQAVIPPCITANLSYDSAIAPEIQTMVTAWSWRQRLLFKLSRVWWKSIDTTVAIWNRYVKRLIRSLKSDWRNPKLGNQNDKP